MKTLQAFLSSAFTWFLALAVIGNLCIVAGVYVLLGIGFSLIVSGVMLIGCAAFLRRGISA